MLSEATETPRSPEQSAQLRSAGWAPDTEQTREIGWFFAVARSPVGRSATLQTCGQRIEMLVRQLDGLAPSHSLPTLILTQTPSAFLVPKSPQEVAATLERTPVMAAVMAHRRRFFVGGGDVEMARQHEVTHMYFSTKQGT